MGIFIQNRSDIGTVYRFYDLSSRLVFTYSALRFPQLPGILTQPTLLASAADSLRNIVQGHGNFIPWVERELPFVKKMIGYAEKDCRPLAKQCRDLRDTGEYAHWIDGEMDWERFCQDILETDAGFIDAIIHGVERLEGKGHSTEVPASMAQKVAEAEPLKEHGNGPGRGKKRVDNINSFNEQKGGTSSDYLIRRLKRDAPEVAEDLAEGKYSSVSQAAIAAGIVKQQSPYEKAVKAIVFSISNLQFSIFKTKNMTWLSGIKPKTFS